MATEISENTQLKLDLIEATNNLKNAEEITPELLDAFVNEAKESNKNAEKLTELQGFVESFDKEMEDSGNPIMATVKGMRESGGLGAFQSVMAQSIAGLLSPSAIGYGAADWIKNSSNRNNSRWIWSI